MSPYSLLTTSKHLSLGISMICHLPTLPHLTRPEAATHNAQAERCARLDWLDQKLESLKMEKPMEHSMEDEMETSDIEVMVIMNEVKVCACCPGIHF